tara:strand:+ start:7284 stop:8078 length:795 start_codon:yes stop_codon:yes gene_type:complete
MSLKHLSDTIYKVDLPCTTKMVLILLANYANEKSECYPSKAHLAKLGGMTERTVTNSMKKLIELGFVEVISQGGGIHSTDLEGKKYGKVNRYRLAEIANPESNSPLETDMERDSKDDSNPESLSSNPENGSSNPESLSSNPERDSYNSLIDSSIDSQIDSKDILVVPPKPKKPKRASAVPDEFLVDQRMLDWLTENQITTDWRTETNKFLDHHRAKGSIMADWVAAWRTWMRNSLKFSAPRQMPPATAKQQVSESLTNIHDTDW